MVRSVRPWKASSKQMTAGRLVYARAILMEFSMASAPEFTRMVFFGKSPGARALSFSATAIAFVGSDGEAQVQVFFQLLADPGGHARRAVADIEAADAAGKIEIAIAIDVFDDSGFGARGENGIGVGRAARDRGFAAGHQSAGLGAGDFGAKLDGFHGQPLYL